VFGSAINGAVIAMEEQRANGADIDDEAINSVKTGLMGPLAGIGDSISQGTITPLLLALGISIAGVPSVVNGLPPDLASVTGNPLGPIVFLLLETVTLLVIGYVFWMQGYARGRSLIVDVLRGGVLDRVIAGANVLGNLVLGALAATYVTLSIARQDAPRAPAAHPRRGDVVAHPATGEPGAAPRRVPRRRHHRLVPVLRRGADLCHGQVRLGDLPAVRAVPEAGRDDAAVGIAAGIRLLAGYPLDILGSLLIPGLLGIVAWFVAGRLILAVFSRVRRLRPQAEPTALVVGAVGAAVAIMAYTAAAIRLGLP
jgi:hypothetical protein